LKKETIKYSIKNKLFLGFFRVLLTRKGKMFYTNFELGRVNRFNSDSWINYFIELDKTGCFYTRRWGDAPFKYIGIRLFNNLIKSEPIPAGFTYTHGSTYHT
jgi:hypothetical protein